MSLANITKSNRFLMLLQTKVPEYVHMDHTALYPSFDSFNNTMLKYAEEKKMTLASDF